MNSDDYFFLRIALVLFAIAALTQVLPNKYNESDDMFGKPQYRLTDGKR